MNATCEGSGQNCSFESSALRTVNILNDEMIAFRNFWA